MIKKICGAMLVTLMGSSALGADSCAEGLKKVLGDLQIVAKKIKDIKNPDEAKYLREFIITGNCSYPGGALKLPEEKKTVMGAVMDKYESHFKAVMTKHDLDSCKITKNSKEKKVYKMVQDPVLDKVQSYLFWNSGLSGIQKSL
jgi:hypothetical protein